MAENGMCFKRLITEVQTIKLRVVTTTGDCASVYY